MSAGRSTRYIYIIRLISKDLKRTCIVMNQKSRQAAKKSAEKDFFELLNNSNFEYHCRNNLYSCIFEAIFDKMEDQQLVKI